MNVTLPAGSKVFKVVNGTPTAKFTVETDTEVIAARFGEKYNTYELADGTILVAEVVDVTTNDATR